MLFGSMLAGNFLNLPERVVSPFHQPSEREQPLSAGIPDLYHWWPESSLAQKVPMNSGACSFHSHSCPFQGNTKIGAEVMSPRVCRMAGVGGEGIGAGGVGALRTGEGGGLTLASLRA